MDQQLAELYKKIELLETRMQEKQVMPTYAQLTQEPKYDYDKFLTLIHSPCNKDWVKSHPLVKIKDKTGKYVSAKYLPIDKIELLLWMIFGAKNWKREILRENQFFNSVSVTVRLWYRIPGDTEWLFHDGIGAVGVQTDKDSAASELSAIKADAVMKAAPAAASYALGNAAEKLGELFGANLNKWSAETFSDYGLYEFESNGEQQEAVTQIEETELKF